MASKFKLKINHWAKNSKANAFSVSIAQQTVAHADIVFKWMQLVRSQTMDHYLPGVDTDLWQDLYRDHRKITEAVSFVYEPNGMWPYRTKNIQKELDQSRLVSNWAKREPEDFETFVREEYSPAKLVKMFRLSRRLGVFSYRRQLKELHKIAQRKIPVAEDAEFDERVKSSPGLHFYMRIALPCMCVYRKFPLSVLRAAKRECLNHESPSFEWIEKLIRLDPFMASAKFVCDWVNLPGGSTTLERRKLLNQWENEGLETGRKLTRQKVKYWFGGYIWAIAQRFGKVLIPRPFEYGQEGPMSAGEILELFHAWAWDCSPERGVERLSVRDEDLADIQPESWRRAIRPYRNQWDHIISGGGGWNSG